MPGGLFIKTITLISLYPLKKKMEMFYFKESMVGEIASGEKKNLHKKARGEKEDELSTTLRFS